MNKFFLLIIILVLTPVFALGQTGDTLPLGIKEQVSIDVSPDIPAPGEEFTIRVESFSTDLNKAQITWTVNGVNELSGTGEILYTGIAPENGRRLNITVTMVKNTGGVLTENILIAPAGVELAYEAKTYTPPFYKGKALYTNESEVRVVAFPELRNSAGNLINSNNLVYTWKVDKKVDQSQSGFGKNVLNFKGNLIARPLDVEVQVESLDSGAIAKNKITLNTRNPIIILYEKNPTFGTLFEFSLNNKGFIFDREEVDLLAVPLFFSSDDGFTDLSYRWSLNGDPLINPSRKNTMLFRREGESSGIATIGVEIKHDKNILQFNEGNIVLDLDAEVPEDFEF